MSLARIDPTQNVTCYTSMENDFIVLSQYERVFNVFRTRVQHSKTKEVIAEYIGINWKSMEYWHQKGVYLVWEINSLSRGQDDF